MSGFVSKWLGVYLKCRLGDLLEGTEGAERTQKFLSVILRVGDELRLHPDQLYTYEATSSENKITGT